jgi:hypothetical protein
VVIVWQLEANPSFFVIVPVFPVKESTLLRVGKIRVSFVQSVRANKGTSVRNVTRIPKMEFLRLHNVQSCSVYVNNRNK